MSYRFRLSIKQDLSALQTRAKTKAVGGLASLILGAAALPTIAGDEACVIFDELASVAIFHSIFSQIIEIDDSILYLSTGIREAQIYDITDATKPILLGGLGVGDHFRLVTDISVQEDIAYISTEIGGGFYIVDVSEPTTPVTMSQIDELFTFNAIASGNLVYTVGHFTNVPGAPTSLFIIDVTNPSSPNILSSTMFNANDVWDSKAVKVDGDTVYIPGGDGGLIIMDASDPSTPVITGVFPSEDLTMDVRVVGTTAYIADGTGGLKIADVSDPSSIALIGELSTTDTLVRIQLHDNICYATLWNEGVIALDVSDPTSITIVGAIPLANPDSNDVMTDMVIQDGMVFTAENALLRVLSVENHCNFTCNNRVDFNNDGTLNFFDVSIFLIAFASQDPLADLLPDGQLDFHDISVFIADFQGGC